MTALVDIGLIAENAPTSATCGALDFIAHATHLVESRILWCSATRKNECSKLKGGLKRATRRTLAPFGLLQTTVFRHFLGFLELRWTSRRFMREI
jgi:hypothetical protein